MTLIQQLSKGEIAVENTDGTLEELRKVLKTAFPKDSDSGSNSWIYKSKYFYE